MTQEEIAKAYDMAERGYSVNDIAKALYMSRSTIKRCISYTEHRKRTMKAMYESGASNSEIADYMGYRTSLIVSSMLAKWGIREKRHGKA